MGVGFDETIVKYLGRSVRAGGIEGSDYQID